MAARSECATTGWWPPRKGVLFHQLSALACPGALARDGHTHDAAANHSNLELLSKRLPVVPGQHRFDQHCQIGTLPDRAGLPQIECEVAYGLRKITAPFRMCLHIRRALNCSSMRSSFRLFAVAATTGERFERAVSIMARLRAPGGCPWDREQTFDSIKPYTLEETYEVLEAIDNRDWDELSGELGDLLLQVLFYAQMSEEQGTFSIDDVLERLSSKLVRRHPHVFGDAQADTASEVVRNWEAIKAEEKKKRLAAGGGKTAKDADEPQSVLGGVSPSMPSLLEAHKLSSRAAHVGFDWPNIQGLFDKLQEETEELREHLKEFPEPGPGLPARGVAGSGQPRISDELRFRLEEEVGDLFFVLVNIARYLSLDPESALRKTNRKFKRRFQWMEARLRESGRTPEQASTDELESLWQQAKQLEKSQA